jgi:hypothetical protein
LVASARSANAHTGSAAATDDRTKVGSRTESLILVKEVQPIAVSEGVEISDALSSIASAFYAPEAGHRPRRLGNVADRTVDLLLGSIILVFVLPVLVALMVVVRVIAPGSPFWRCACRTAALCLLASAPWWSTADQRLRRLSARHVQIWRPSSPRPTAAKTASPGGSLPPSHEPRRAAAAHQRAARRKATSSVLDRWYRRDGEIRGRDPRS